MEYIVSAMGTTVWLLNTKYHIYREQYRTRSACTRNILCIFLGFKGKTFAVLVMDVMAIYSNFYHFPGVMMAVAYAKSVDIFT